MASKRDLKKRIRNICGDLAGECIIAKSLVPGIDADKMNDIVYDIATLQTATLKRVTFVYDKSRKDFADCKVYNKTRGKYFVEAYSKLISEFDKNVNEIVSSMNKVLPAAQKEANVNALKS